MARARRAPSRGGLNRHGRPRRHLFCRIEFQFCLFVLVAGSLSFLLPHYYFSIPSTQFVQDDFEFLNELSFVENPKFAPHHNHNRLQDFRRENNARFYRLRSVQLKLGLVFTNLLVDPYQDVMITFASALKQIGYEIQVFTLEDGPVNSFWSDEGISVRIIQTKESMNIDWLNFDAVFLNSLGALDIMSRLMQEPFKSVPVIWTVREHALAARLKQYNSTSQTMLVDSWRKVFRRVNAIVFPNYNLPIAYSICDTGNYFVIPELPTKVQEVDHFLISNKDVLRAKMGCGPEDFIISIVGSQHLYKTLLLDQARVLQALLPLFQGNSNPRLKIVVLAGVSISNHSVALKSIALNLKYPIGVVNYVDSDEDADSILRLSDIVIYASFRKEQSFPYTLLKAMLFEKPIVAPDLSIIKKSVVDRFNGYLFAKKNISVLTEIMTQVVSNGKLSLKARNVGFNGRHIAMNLMVSKSSEGYALLLENIIMIQPEVEESKAVPKFLVPTGKWFRSETAIVKYYQSRTWLTDLCLDKFEKQFNRTQTESSMDVMDNSEELMKIFWDEEKTLEIANRRKQAEDEELKSRSVERRGTWEEVDRIVKRAERLRDVLHEREYGELERTGQPLCIYEPYYGEGTWPFLHRTSLYRGLGLSTKGRRPEFDDIDAASRLPLLKDPYYRDFLGEYGGFFAIANRIDSIHKNAWIGFQSWRATARNESLSKIAERSLLDAIEAGRYGDALFFWARMDMDPRNNPLSQDFWSFCDAINAGMCRYAFYTAMNKMYGVNEYITALPPMPADGGTWSVMHSWVLPTRSFLEFVMFSRMFVAELDAQFYHEHRRSGLCYLSVTKDKQCYSRMLELVINVWAYHGGRRIVYVDPENGLMEEQHELESRRRGKMWVKWFKYSTLKEMDEEMAEVADIDPPYKWWLWPSTGEVVWPGILKKEKNLRRKKKLMKRQHMKEKISRMRKKSRTHDQKPLGKYVKPPPETVGNSSY